MKNRSTAGNSTLSEFLREKIKKKKNTGWNPLSCGRLHKQWKLNSRTNLSLSVLWLPNALREKVGWKDRQTEIKTGMETEWAVWVHTIRQLVFKGLGVQNQPGNSSWAPGRKVPKAPCCFQAKNEHSLKKNNNKKTKITKPCLHKQQAEAVVHHTRPNS